VVHWLVHKIFFFALCYASALCYAWVGGLALLVANARLCLYAWSLCLEFMLGGYASGVLALAMFVGCASGVLAMFVGCASGVLAMFVCYARLGGLYAMAMLVCNGYACMLCKLCIGYMHGLEALAMLGL